MASVGVSCGTRSVEQCMDSGSDRYCVYMFTLSAVWYR